MNPETTRRVSDVTVTLGEDAIDMFPLYIGERGVVYRLGVI